MLKIFLSLAFTVVFAACHHTEPAAPPGQHSPATTVADVQDEPAPLPTKPQSPPTDGEWETFHPDGARATACRYVDGKIAGEYHEWHTNEQPKITGNYRSGLKHGTWTTFDERGKVLFSEKYCFGILDNQIRDQFLNFIRAQQQEHVGNSCGTLAHECFTTMDLSYFRSGKVAETLRHDLTTDGNFLQLMLAVQSKGTAFWENLAVRGRSTYKKTWAQIGKITCAGQTDAGQLAEKSIAGTVVGAAADLLRQKSATLEAKLAESK